MNRLFRRHWIALGCAVVVAAIMIAPHVQWGIYPMGSDAESHYLARIQEVVDGNGWGNPFLNDARSTNYSPYLSLVEYILAYPSKVLGIPVPDMNLIYKALFPAGIFLLIYALFLKLTNDRAWGMFAGLCIILGYEVFTFHGLFSLGSQVHQFALYARPVNPQFSSLLLFAYLIVAYAVFQRYRRRDMIVLAALFGLSFYIYFYLCTWLLMFQGVLVLLALARRRFAEAGWWLAMSGIGVALGSPFLVHLWRVMQSPLYASFSAMMDVVRGHAVHVSVLGIVVSVLLLYRMVRRPLGTREWFLLGLLATAWISINQQVITGITLQYGHYHWYYNMPVYVIVLFVLASDIPTLLYRRLAYAGGAVLALLSVASSIITQVVSYRYWAPTITAVQRYAPALRWLDENTPKDSVVLSNEMLSELIPVYTHNDVFWNPYAAYYLLPPGLVQNALTTYLKLEKNAIVPGDQVCELMKPKYDALLGDHAGATFSRRIDYVIVNTKTDSWNVRILGKSREVFSNDGVVIYALSTLL